MSQDRTFVPGMESTGPSKNDFMYSRSGAPTGTYVPGMAPKSNGQEGSHMEAKNEPSAEQKTRGVASGMPVVGFLYSISNQGVPEYWPIQIGYNRIGRNTDNEVMLKEQTVSGLHASITVQKKRNGEVIAVIRLEQGKTSVLVNDEEVDLRYGSECKNGDVIQIGSNYKFMFILVNAEAAGLCIAEGFMPVETEATQSQESEDDVLSRINRAPRTTITTVGTIAMDGTPIGDGPGKTRFM